MKQNFSKELLVEAKKTVSSAQLMKLASENGMELDKADAEELFSKLHPKDGSISDNELEAVAGGGCGNQSGNNATEKEPEFYPGQRVYLCNSGHTFGSLFCNNPVCRGNVFQIVKPINDTGTYLIECMGCDWTYHAVKENMR